MSTFGPAYNEGLDGKRIKKQREVIRDFLLENRNWFTLSELHSLLQYPEASISAQLRHLRKERFGSYTVNKKRRTTGTWEYKLYEPKGIEVCQNSATL
jgi:hypothetical protein